MVSMKSNNNRRCIPHVYGICICNCEGAANERKQETISERASEPLRNEKGKTGVKERVLWWRLMLLSIAYQLCYAQGTAIMCVYLINICAINLQSHFKYW